MSKPNGIIILGANGCGKSTLGYELARVMNVAHFDVEEYYFYKTDIPYTKPRSERERNEMLLYDIKKHGSFIMSGDISRWSQEFLTMFQLVIFFTVPTNIRLERIQNREYERWGDRISMGGDMYEQHQKFIEFAASRDITILEERALAYRCPILNINGVKTLKENIDQVLTYIDTRNHYDALIDEDNGPVWDEAPLRNHMDK